MLQSYGQKEEADKVSAEIAELFGEDAAATQILTDESSLKAFVAESSKPESMLKKLPDMDESLDLGIDDDLTVAPVIVEKTNLNKVSESLSLDSDLASDEAEEKNTQKQSTLELLIARASKKSKSK